MLNNFNFFISLFKKSADASSERSRRVYLTSISNLAGQVIGLITGLISVPLTISYLGLERFGLWMALSTALSLIAYSDLGIGIGTQDRISAAVSQQSYSRARKVFYSSFILILCISAVIVVVAEIAIPYVNWKSLYVLNSDDSIKEVVPTAKALMYVFSIGLISGIVQRVFSALQSGYVVALINAVSRIVSLGLLILAVHYEMGLPVLVFVFAGIPSLFMIFFGTPLLFLKNEWLCDFKLSERNIFDAGSLKDVMKIGSWGLLASIAYYTVSNSSVFFISTKFGASAVADYAALLKILTIPAIVLTHLLGPYWPAISSAYGRNEMVWIYSVYKKMLKVTICFTVVFSVVILLFGRFIINEWANNSGIVPSNELLFAGVGFMVVGFWNTMYSTILNGLSKYRSQATLGLFFALLFALIAALLPSGFGKESVIYAVTLGYFIRTVILGFEVRYYFNMSSVNDG